MPVHSKAVCSVKTCEFTCPLCDWSIPAPGGSLFWTFAEMPKPLKMPCPGGCGLTLTLRAPWHGRR